MIQLQEAHITLIKSLLLWIVFITILLPVVIPVLFVLFLYKTSVICAARLFGKSELLHPINGIDISFCVDDFWTRPKGSIAYIWILKGPIDPNLIYNRFREAIESTTNTSSTTDTTDDEPYNYDRLTSIYPSFWMGIPFWTKTKEPFQMKNHLRIIKYPVNLTCSSTKQVTLSSEEVEEEEDSMKQTNRFESRAQLNSYLSLWMQDRFKANLPLWEVLVIPEFFLNDSSDPNKKLGLMALKSHHIIGDGYSKLKLLEKVVDRFRPTAGSNSSHVRLNSSPSCFPCVSKDIRKRNDNDHMKKGKSINPSSVGKHQLSQWWTNFNNNFLPLLIFTPTVLWRLGRDFVFHRDCFTHHKSTSNVLMSNTILDMKKLKWLKGKFKSELDQDIPLIVIEASILGGALRRLLLLHKEMELDSCNIRVKDTQGTQTNDGALNEDDSSVITNSTRAGQVETRDEGHDNECSRVPKHTNFVMALPLGKPHPGKFKFCNHWTHGIFNVEVQEPDVFKRTLKLNENFQANLSLRWPEVFHNCVVPGQSLFPKWMWNKITNFNMGSPIGCTNLSGPLGTVFVGGQEVLEKYAYVGLLWRHSSMTCAFFSYRGMLSVTMVANQDVVKNESSAEKVVACYMQKELEKLLANFNGM